MWLVGGIYGYGYHVQVWLVGVVVRRYIDILTIIINFSYILHLYILALLLAAASVLLCSFFKYFFGLVSVIFLTIYSKRYSKNIRDCSKKSRSANIII